MSFFFFEVEFCRFPVSLFISLFPSPPVFSLLFLTFLQPKLPRRLLLGPSCSGGLGVGLLLFLFFYCFFPELERGRPRSSRGLRRRNESEGIGRLLHLSLVHSLFPSPSSAPPHLDAEELDHRSKMLSLLTQSRGKNQRRTQRNRKKTPPR